MSDPKSENPTITLQCTLPQIIVLEGAQPMQLTTISGQQNPVGEALIVLLRSPQRVPLGLLTKSSGSIGSVFSFLLVK